MYSNICNDVTKRVPKKNIMLYGFWLQLPWVHIGSVCIQFVLGMAGWVIALIRTLAFFSVTCRHNLSY